MKHECCSEYCQIISKPPPFPQQLIPFLSRPPILLRDLFNATIYDKRLEQQVPPSDASNVLSRNVNLLSLPFPLHYLTSFYPIIATLIALVVIVVIMRTSMYFHNNIPSFKNRCCFATTKSPNRIGRLQRSDSLHEYDSFGMSKTCVSEIQPVFICLNGSSTSTGANRYSVSTTNDQDCSNDDRATVSDLRSTVRHSSSMESSGAASNDRERGDRCSSSTSSSNEKAHSKTYNNNCSQTNRSSNPSTVVRKASQHDLLQQNSINRSMSHDCRKLNNYFNNSSSNNRRSDNNNTGCFGAASQPRAAVTTPSLGTPKQQKLSTAFSYLTENGSVNSVLKNDHARTPSSISRTSNSVASKYINC